MSTVATAAPRRVPLRVLRRVAPGLLVALVAVAALAGPFLAPHAIDKPVTAPYAPAGDGAPLGGDQLGRDVLSRLLHGGTALIGSALLVAVVVTGLAALIGCFAVLRPVLGRAVERTADVVILLPPILGIMLIALAWPDGGRLAVNTAAIVLGIPYAVRIVAGAAAPSRSPATSRPPPPAAKGSGTSPCANCCPTCAPPCSPCSACVSWKRSTSSPWPDSCRSVPNPRPPTGR